MGLCYHFRCSILPEGLIIKLFCGIINTGDFLPISTASCLRPNWVSCMLMISTLKATDSTISSTARMVACRVLLHAGFSKGWDIFSFPKRLRLPCPRFPRFRVLLRWLPDTDISALDVSVQLFWKMLKFLTSPIFRSWFPTFRQVAIRLPRSHWFCHALTSLSLSLYNNAVEQKDLMLMLIHLRRTIRWSESENLVSLLIFPLLPVA